MSEHLSASPTGLRRTWARLRYWPVVLAVTAAGFGGAALLPIFGPAALAMICGVGLRTAAPARLTDLVPARLGSRVLQLSIVLLGLSVNLGTVVSVAAGEGREVGGVAPHPSCATHRCAATGTLYV